MTDREGHSKASTSTKCCGIMTYLTPSLPLVLGSQLGFSNESSNSICQAVTDAPCCLFVEELVAAYPDAKVVLTSRTGESWLASMKATILEQISWRSWSLLALVDRDFSRPYWALLNSVVSVWSCGLPAWRPSSHPVMMKSMEEHNALVRRVVPPERLLEFHPSDGWAPLCEFLDVPTPDRKFPHVNDGKYFVGFHVSLYWRRWFHAALGAGRVVATLGLAIGLGYYWAAAQ